MNEAAPRPAEQARTGARGRPEAATLFSALAAPAFVLLWSTGFIGAKFGMPYAEPMTFLALRFACVAAILAFAVAALPRRSRGAPLTPRQWGVAALAGAALHAGYLGGVFVAVSWGLDAGLSALIAGLGPIFTALIGAAALGETLSRRQWLGMAVGLAGVALSVSPSSGANAPIAAVLICLAGAVAFGLGSVAQRSLPAAAPIVAVNVVQYATAFALTAAASWAFETQTVDWTPNFVFALVWLIFALSIGAIGLFYALLRRGAAAQAASLVFLTPGVTALVALFLFGETITLLQLAGFAIAAAGVLLVTRRG